MLPMTFVNTLVPTFDTKDTTKLLFIDTYNMTLVGKKGMYYGRLEPISMDDYRPYYWVRPHGFFDDPVTFDDKVREYIKAHKSDFGESIRKDYRIMQQAFIYAKDRPPLLLDDPPEYPRDTSDHWGTLWLDSL
ncbi:hypothetical protein [Lactiplantibacillus plantarum]|uniref:hypothetical protein n=1 Tax=Lactiplantibacillus plantarum TaxID=1590 RepID=UPI00097746FF|nr:hypothetical protein [Lactiplantibacillus plantarum]